MKYLNTKEISLITVSTVAAILTNIYIGKYIPDLDIMTLQGVLLNSIRLIFIVLIYLLVSGYTLDFILSLIENKNTRTIKCPVCRQPWKIKKWG